MKRLLVTGMSSFLGKELTLFPQKEWKVIGLYNSKKVVFPNVDCLQCDITNSEKLEQLFNSTQPDAVIHFAALSNPNYCELHPVESFKVNVEASTQLAILCEKRQIPLVFTSTDLVFDGNNAPYSENDVLEPIMVYGKHKAEAEKRILNLNQKAIIVRFPVMFGNGGFMKNWIKTLKEGETISAFTDEYRSMISSFSAIGGLFLLLNRKEKGVWNLGGASRISRYDFALQMAETFDLPKTQILPSLRAQVSMPAARPADVSMDSRKAYSAGFTPQPINEALEKIKNSPIFKLI